MRVSFNFVNWTMTAIASLCDDGHVLAHGGHGGAAFDSDAVVNADTVPNSIHRAPAIGDYWDRDAFDAADVLKSNHFDGFSRHFYYTQIVCNAFGHTL